MIFADRADAGKRLADALRTYEHEDTIVFAIPRGGVIIGYEVATALHAPLEVIIPRKIGAPQQPELAIGAVAGENIRIMDESAIRYLHVSPAYLESETARQREEIIRRRQLYRDDRPFPEISSKTVLLVDDGVATGNTTIAAARELRHHHPQKLVLAVPVAPPDTVERLRREVDDLVVLETPEPFLAVGAWYAFFDQTTDEEVVQLLRKADQSIQ